jgi:O-antigen/teichoic acid export membrane protein
MLAAVVLHVALNLLLIPAWGIVGAAFASFVTTAFWNVAAACFIRRRFGFFIGCLPWRSLPSV